VSEIRAPYDVINLATLFGFQNGQAKPCLSTTALQTLHRAELKGKPLGGKVSLLSAPLSGVKRVKPDDHHDTDDTKTTTLGGAAS